VPLAAPLGEALDYMDIKHQQFKVSDFLSWQREGSLVLSPSFQRRAVWQASAKSYLIDTIARGLPVPVVFIRERVDLDSQKTIREVVDGQQRLRTLFTYIDPTSLEDFDPSRDPFTVLSRHNSELAFKSFNRLDDGTRRRILGYEFSTQVLPSTAEDRDILMIFARLNSTGVQLNGQELRNAQYFGLFKSLMYELAFEQLDRWRAWRIFTELQIARMAEVELTSDLVMTMVGGLIGKTQARLNALYKRFDEEFPFEKSVAMRFRRVIDEAESLFGVTLYQTVFSSEVHFYTLFTFLYDQMYGLGSPLQERTPQRLETDRMKGCLLRVSRNFASGDVPRDVFDAIARASSDTGRRQTRHNYLKQVCNAAAR